MTNKEFFKERIWELACDDERIAVDTKTNAPCKCSGKPCEDCALECHKKSHSEALYDWCNEEYVKPCPFEKDELVEVSNSGKDWNLRYFSHITKIGNDEEEYMAYIGGETSKKTIYTATWKYCRKYGTLGGLVKGE